MSMESALQALSSAPTPGATAPTNQSETASAPAQASQESTVNGSGSQQSAASDAPKGGVVGSNDSTEAPLEATPTDENQLAPPQDEADQKVAKKEDPISTKFAALAKKEKLVVRKQEEIKAKEAGFIKREAAIAEREAKMKESDSLWESDVFRALELRGLSYQKLTDMILSGRAAPSEPETQDPKQYAEKLTNKIRKEFEDKEAKREADAKRAQEDAQKRQAEELAAAEENYKAEVGEYISANPDEYELIGLYGQQDLVLETVKEHYEKTKRVLSVKEASDLVEKYLLSEAEKATKTKKFASRFPSTSAPAKKSEAPAPKQTKTLTNNLAQTGASNVPAANDSDRMKRALAALSRAK